MDKRYQICVRCIMDPTDPDIVFDRNGLCNHCKGYDRTAKGRALTDKNRQQEFGRIVNKIKEQGKGHKYDCIVGLSGGIDSTYVAYLAKKLGLRPLAVHVDNGWNSEISEENIKNIVRILDLDLYRYVIDWEEFKDLQIAYLKASVVDIEAVTDHALASSLYKIADQKGIKYILSGTNIVTEGVMPKSWAHNKNDLMNLKSIHSKFGTGRLKNYPTLGQIRRSYYRFIKGIKFIYILNHVSYVKKDAKEIIARELGFRDYGDKHHESIFTRFYQAYILPKKFNIDKRKAHLSVLICSGQITRKDALRKVQEDPYTEEGFKKDKRFVLKKLGLTEGEFERLMGLPIRSHYDFRSDFKWSRLSRFFARRILKIKD